MAKITKNSDLEGNNGFGPAKWYTPSTSQWSRYVRRTKL